MPVPYIHRPYPLPNSQAQEIAVYILHTALDFLKIRATIDRHHLSTNSSVFGLKLISTRTSSFGRITSPLPNACAQA